MKTELKALRAAITARVPVLLWGSPGIGKTAIVEAIAAELGAGFVAVSCPTRPPEDFSGLPVPRESGVVQEPMSWLRRAIQLGQERPGGCIVLLDEIGSAPPATQAALLALVQSRYCGDTAVPTSVAWVAAANPTSQAADGWELPPPTVSRWIHVSWPSPTASEWTDWLAAQSWGGPAGSKARALVAGFLQRRPSAIIAAPAEATRAGQAVPYPCPRSWEAATRLLAAQDDEETRDLLLSAALGPGVSAELSTWLRESDLPDPEAVLRAPESWQPDRARADRTIATLLAVAGAVAERPTQQRYEGAVAVAVRAADAGQSGVAVVALRVLVSSPRIRDASLRAPVALARFGQVLGLIEQAEKGAS